MIPQNLEELLAPIPEAPVGSPLRRIRAELGFAWQFAQVFPAHTESWRSIVAQSAETIAERGESAVGEAESLLSPIAERAKGYTVHCCGHAHIDMDWTWPRYETIATAHDTFLTLDRLMDEYPDLTFAQSQISIYQMMEDHCPEVFEVIKKRIAEGRWCVTAGSWVEGDKNMASGESLARHTLYSKRWLKEHLGLDYDTVKIDWQPDTFGHPDTMPSILLRGGVTRYYRCRPGTGPWIVRWTAPDGSAVIAFRDKGWYCKGWWEETSPENFAKHFVDYLSENDITDFLWIHGIGDHGGGPTRKDLNILREMQTWPCFPTIRHSTIDTYFEAIEAQQDQIEVHRADFNTVFPGCYTSQSRIKKINRASESIIPEAEAISILAEALTGLDYSRNQLVKAWELALFNQFHDILAGSSGHEAMEESVARFREIEAITGSIKMRALRRIASRVDTASTAGSVATANTGTFPSENGVGDVRAPGGVSTWSLSSAECEPLVVFNPSPHVRSEMAMAKVWNKDWQGDKLIIVDEHGIERAAQVVGKSSYMTHKALNIVFPAVRVPPMGYKTCVIKPGELTAPSSGVTMPSANVMENEFLRVEVDPASGAIRSLVSKLTGCDYVPEGEIMAVLESCREVPHGMSAWSIGEFDRNTALTEGGRPLSVDDEALIHDGDTLGMVFSNIDPQLHGPNRACLRTLHTINTSKVVMEIGLSAGSPCVEIGVIALWQEIGSQETGVPVLRLRFPCSLTAPSVTCEIPFGSTERPADGSEIPSQRWIDISGQGINGTPCGITLVNDCKYGFGADESVLWATLLRSSYSPDDYPEIGRHEMRFAIYPHQGECSPADSTRLAASFNLPMSVITSGLHSGDLPPSKSFVEVLTPNVELAAMKKTEDDDNIILRLYETEGRDTEARVRITDIVKPDAAAWETDLLERKLPHSTALMKGGVLSVSIPAHGIVTVTIEQ